MPMMICPIHGAKFGHIVCIHLFDSLENNEATEWHLVPFLFGCVCGSCIEELKPMELPTDLDLLEIVKLCEKDPKWGAKFDQLEAKYMSRGICSACYDEFVSIS